MVISLISSILFGSFVFLLTRWTYPLIIDYSHRRTEFRLKDLLPAIESRDDKRAIRKITALSPWLFFSILILLLLFARSVLAVLISIVVAYLAYKGPDILQIKLKKIQDRKLLEQLPDAINAIANSVKAGESLPVAFRMVATKYNPPVSAVFRTIANRHDAGENFEDALLQVANAIRIDGFDYFTRAIALQAKRGGPAFEMLSEIKTSLIEQDRCDRVIRAATSSGRFTMKFMTYSPLFFIPILSFLQPDWADLLLGNIVGVMITILAVSVYLFGLRWAKDILSIEKI